MSIALLAFLQSQNFCMIHPMEVTCGRKITGGISRATASTEKLLLSNYEKFKHTGDMGKDTEKDIYSIVAW